MSETFLRLELGAECYALPVKVALEVGDLRDVTPVPGSPTEVLGVINLRGQVVPVIDLGFVLLGESPSDPPHVVIIDIEQERAGLAVGRVTGVSELVDISQSIDSDHVVGGAIVDDQLVGVIDVDSVLSAVEQRINV